MIRLRDASNFDGTVDFTGLAGFTHKATEGTSTTHDKYGPRLNAAKDAGVPVLGAYHVLRTPSATNGTLAAQLKFWLYYLDAHTPWWRTHPNFVLQIDAEKWSYDQVPASAVKDFASLLVNSGIPGWKITYASRGQYGDSLRGIATPLWNADYRGSSGGSYPGDDWAPGWAPYSGQTPVILQYTSTPYDENAFRGSLDDLLSLMGTLMTDLDYAPFTKPASVANRPAAVLLADQWSQEMYGHSPYNETDKSVRTQQLQRIEDKLDKLIDAVAALTGAVATLPRTTLPGTWNQPYKVTWVPSAPVTWTINATNADDSAPTN